MTVNEIKFLRRLAEEMRIEGQALYDTGGGADRFEHCYTMWKIADAYERIANRIENTQDATIGLRA